MNSKSCINTLVAAGMFLVLAAVPAQSQEAEGSMQKTFTIPLSNPGEPATLEAGLVSGSITVIGERREDLEVTVASGPSKRRLITPSGPKAIPMASFDLEVSEENNNVDIDSGWNQTPLVITVRAPVNTSVDLKVVNRGDLVVKNLTGTHELENVNGSIEATNISGSVVAETVNLDITVTFDAVDRDTAMAFTSINGDLDVTFPKDLNATLYLSTNRDEIYSDFDVEVEPVEPVVNRSSNNGDFRIELSQDLVARVNGGGPALRFETMHGKISVRSN